MSHVGLKSLDEIAQTICLPNERAAIRLPTYPSIDKTALFRYRYQNTQSLTDVAAASELNVRGRKRFLVSRDPAAPVLVDAVHTLQNSVGANPTIFSGTILARAEPLDIIGDTAKDDTTVTADFEKMYPFEFYSSLPCGRYDSKQWFLIPKTLDANGKATAFLDRIGVALYRSSSSTAYPDSIQVLRTGVSAAGFESGRFVMDYTINLEFINGQGIRTTSNCAYDWTVAGHTGLFTMPPDTILVRIASITYNGSAHMVEPGGLLGPAITNLTVFPVIGLSRSGPVPSDPIAFRCLSFPAAQINPEYHNSVAPFKSTRINASALLLTNVSKVLNKEGTVESSRVLFDPSQGRTIHDADVVTVSTSNPETRYFGALEKGAYTFTAPDQESLVFTTPYESVAVNDAQITDGATSIVSMVPEYVVTRPVIDLNPRYMNCIVLSDLDTNDDTQVAMTLDTHWEFRTISTLYQLDYSRMPLEVYHAAMLACMKAGFFFENNNHHKILQVVGKGLKFAAPLIPGGNMMQLAHSAMQSVANQQAKKKKPQPQPTKKTSRKERGSMKQKGFK